MKERTKILFVPSFKDKISYMVIIAMILVFIVALYFQIAYQHIDDDDSRFVVNIADIIRTNSMFLFNPGTGEELPKWAGELVRDVASPWAVFQAYVAFLSGIPATIFAHTIQPIALFILLFCIQWELSGLFVGERIIDRSLFCIFLWLLIWFGEYTGWSAEGFIVRRIWQGKAIVAGMGIPYMILLLICFYNEGEIWLIIVLLFVNLAMCLLSNMGILFGFVLVGVFGLVYGVIKKSLKVSFLLWLTVIPNLIYGSLSLNLWG